MQQIFLGLGAVAKKTYVDDVFSTYLWAGSGSARSINNGINLSESGGMVWIKGRSFNYDHIINDTIRGAGKRLKSNASSGEATSTDWLSAFNSNGFSLGTDNDVNNSGQTYSSFTFRKAPGFFTIKEYTGSGSTQSLTHDLGSIPGCIMVKRTDSTADWGVYHRGQNGGVDPEDYRLRLNSSTTENNDTYWGDTAPTATHFTVGDAHTEVNLSGATYIAYLFAGGSAGGSSANIDITGKTVTSIGGAFSSSYPLSNVHDGVAETSNAANIAYVPDGNGIFDVYVDLSSPHVVTKYKIAPQGGSGLTYNNPTLFEVYGSNDTSSWNYITTVASGTSNWVAGQYREFQINTANTYRYWRIRVIANNGGGTSISEWKLEGYSQAIDTAANIFGKSGDQNVIKTSSYVGNNNSDGPEINLGWEPQFILLKPVGSAENWGMWDSMRGIVTGGNDMRLLPNTTHAELTNFDGISLTPTGFKITTSNELINPNGTGVVYVAIRRPDGYVGKPPSLGTDVFAMDTGAGSSSIPNFDSGFPVDFQFLRQPASTYNWYTGTRLQGNRYLATNNTDAEGTASSTGWVFDSNEGWNAHNGYNSTYQSWMWKRHTGFEVQAYTGVSGNGTRPHNMNTTPEMIWCKNRDQTDGWAVFHKDLGTYPQDKYLRLDTDSSVISSNQWYLPPTSTYWHTASGGLTNVDGEHYIAMLFASTDVSKVGSYTGTGSTNQTITTGFQPRFVIVKCTSHTGGWFTWDTVRGWGSGIDADKYLELNSSSSQSTFAFGEPTSTGFLIDDANNGYNGSGRSYIYYAHA